MDELLFARAQMGLSLVFHIVFSVLGAAVPAARAADIDPVRALRYE
jgi:ABC-type lipoprotein release transport system permease subunit